MIGRKGFWLQLGAFIFDVCAVAVAWASAYLMRFEFTVPAEFAATGEHFLPAVAVLYGASFWMFGLYRGMWLFASLPDLVRIVKGIASAAVLCFILVLLVRPSPTVPRSVLVITPLLVLLIMGGARAAYRTFKEFNRYGDLLAKGKPVIIVGAGQAAASLTRELARSSEWRLVGYVDDDRTKHSREMHGARVLGAIGDLERIAREAHAEHVIVAIPGAPLERQKEVFELCVRSNLKAMVLPALTGLDEGKPFLSRIRSIDLEDLLGRAAVVVDTPQVAAMLKGEVVLVTGAGGSIGSELCRQIARFAPRELVALDVSEFALYRLSEDFQTYRGDIVFTALAADVKDTVMLEHTMATYRPSVVFHAAAYKHVPLMEEVNTWQAVRNNVLGTLRLGEAAARHKVRRFVLISSDKAVNPTNVMGATKRLAEIVCVILQHNHSETTFEVVRFGNVLGSDGSVVPKFQEQIARGGPVTVTHPEITRYFMTIPEASQLVLQASSMGQGGEIFLLDMGKPVRIADLARDLIRLYGFRSDQIPIVFTGLRPGEKLYEELLVNEEHDRPTHHPKLRIASARPMPPGGLAELLPFLEQQRILGDEEVRRELQRWVPEYAPASHGAASAASVPK